MAADEQFRMVLDETKQEKARLEGELIALRAQLASSLASEDHLRIELGTANAGHAVTDESLAHAQQRLAAAQQRIRELEESLLEARRLQRQAEDERATVISVLSRRAKRQLDHPTATPS